MKTILIVDDTPQIIQFLTVALSASGYQVIAATTAAEGLAQARSREIDLLILDLGLPDMNGKDVIAALRPDFSVPIIVLSAHDQEIERIMALDLGADDFIAKPFGIGELLARVRVCLRSPIANPPPAAALVIDRAAHQVFLHGAAVKLTPKEFQLAEYLSSHPGKLLTHRSILKDIWGPAHVEDIPYLRVFIGQLRKKLSLGEQSPIQIQSEAGIGYRWIERGSQ